MDSSVIYSIGWNPTYQLEWEQNRIKYTSYISEEELRMITCELCEKRMQINVIEKNKENLNIKTLVEQVDIDLNNNGKRWEGTAINGEPCGYGCYFDENNKLEYSGFIMHKMKVGYGKDYYADANAIKYHGSFMNDLRHGWGQLYDIKGELLYEGYWVFGQNSCFDLTIENNCEDDSRIHNLVRELKIGMNCFCKMKVLKIVNYANLKHLEIGDGSFKEVCTFEIGDCNKLEILMIGNECFTTGLETLKLASLNRGY